MYTDYFSPHFYSMAVEYGSRWQPLIYLNTAILSHLSFLFSRLNLPGYLSLPEHVLQSLYYLCKESEYSLYQYSSGNVVPRIIYNIQDVVLPVPRNNSFTSLWSRAFSNAVQKSISPSGSCLTLLIHVNMLSINGINILLQYSTSKPWILHLVCGPCILPP